MIFKIFIDVSDPWPLVAAAGAWLLAVTYIVRRATFNQEDE